MSLTYTSDVIGEDTFTISDKKGTEIMEGMLLEEYYNSPNLKGYISAFTEEMDTLFLQLDKVYLGRQLIHAVGEQLDVLGDILDQKRSILLPAVWFGFVGAPSVDGMSDQTLSPSDGGLFRDENLEGFETFPLSDEVYRRLLLAKAFTNHRQHISINNAYFAIYLILGKVPSHINITVPAPREVQIDMSSPDTNNTDAALMQYFIGKYIIPLGTFFSINRI